jgi:hypothetical protein
MKLNDFKKLEESMEEQDFNKSYRNINMVMFYLSIFGNLASIFLAYFLLSKILSGAITDNPLLVGAASVILLGGLELLKREIFDKFSLQQLKHGSLIKKDVLPLAVISFMLIALSFYSSLKGASEFSSKAKEIETESVSNVKTFEDSLNRDLKMKVDSLDRIILANKEKIESKDKESTDLAATNPYQPRLKDLRTQLAELRQDNKDIDLSKKELKKEIETKVKEFETESKEEASTKKTENKDNSFFFIIISTLIELIILAGVYFNEYYKWRSYQDFKKKLDKDSNFQKWYNYNAILEIIINSDTKVNDKLPSGKNIQDLCKVNGIILLNKDVVDFNKLMISLGIFKSSGSSKYYCKTKETAQEILKKHFKMD